MANRCPTAKVIGTSEIKDHKLTFRGPHGHAVATVEPCKGKVFQPMCGRLRQWRKDTWSIWRLAYLYRKETMKVIVDKKTVNAMVYIMNEGRPLEQPSCYDYLTIIEGANSTRFDIEFSWKAVEDSDEKDDVILESESKAKELEKYD